MAKQSYLHLTPVFFRDFFITPPIKLIQFLRFGLL